MTASGNSTVLFTLLAVFVACAGYAVGRLHQWYRTDQDREVAYRDGYDMAARSTFSLAARLVGRRRDRSAIRASATVHRAGAVHPADAVLPAASLAASAGPAGSDVKDGQPSWTPFPVPGATSGIRPEVRDWSTIPASQVADPADAANRSAPGRPSLARPADPAPHAGLASSVVTSAEGAGSGEVESESGVAGDGSGGSPKRHRRGRHLVPDELVRAATYRLSPDRVARAKVPEPEHQEAQGPRHSVPKPRQAGTADGGSVVPPG